MRSHTLLLPLLLALVAPLASADVDPRKRSVEKNPTSAPAESRSRSRSEGTAPAGPTAAGNADLHAAIALEQRALQAARDGDGDAAALALAELATRFPGVLPAVHPPLLRFAVEEASRGGNARVALLQALVDADYASRETGDGSGYAYELALERLQQGDLEAAARAHARIQAPEQLVLTLIDRRFDPLTGGDEAGIDIEAASRRHVDRLRTRAFLDQNVLALQVVFGQAQLVVGDFAEALALAEQVEASFAEAQPWLDPDQRFSMRLVRMQAQFGLGREQEAVADLAAAVQAGDAVGGEFPRLLLAALQCSRGDYAEALKTLEPVPAPENLLGLLRASIVGCAASRTGDTAAFAAALAWAREHRALMPRVYTEVLLYDSRLDEAAADLIARLRDPETRADALIDVQDFRELPTAPGERILKANGEALLARADVQAAIAEVGRRRAWPIYKP
ncbi:hypothetical protein [Arenimonas composti]|uniref:Tetratricopeptide repeat protein n=1 Tax=Arenimonas composti TR7-09 = DSM 18010 TaxID=1121013 RepID=A0A091B9Z9_9GAMM|nr:hypothetical protein [Arenimonas composti]KFN49443.1 hypothetical protein P873_10750 [Arenimonas composti TR7-09 = DSM 18010]